MVTCEREVTDFSVISVLDEGRERTFRPQDAVRRYGESVYWLEERLAEPFDGPTVVMTHHLSSARCVSDRYARDPISGAFASRLDWLVERHQPALWILGHTHDSFDFRIGLTRLLCNPRGYLGRQPNSSFDGGLTVSM